VFLNRRQAGYAEALQTVNFNLFYPKGSFNVKADTLSRCQAFTSSEGSTTAAGQQTLFSKEQWLQEGDMQLDNDDIEVIRIGAMEVEQLLPGAKEHNNEKALLDEDYMAIYNQLSSGETIDKGYVIQDDSICWKNTVYAP